MVCALQAMEYGGGDVAKYKVIRAGADWLFKPALAK